MIFSKKSTIFLCAVGLAAQSNQAAHGFVPKLALTTPRPTWQTFSTTDVVENCGCQETVYSGKPSDFARSLNPREAVRGTTFFSVDGAATTMDDLIGRPTDDRLSVVVYLRSLG